MIPFSQMFRTHQSASVPAGQTVRVFYGKIPNSCQGFIKRLANTIWYPNVTYVVKVDGAVFDSLDRDVALTEPLVYEGENQILVNDMIEVYAVNDSANNYTLGFQVDGVAFHMATKIAEIKNGKK